MNFKLPTKLWQRNSVHLYIFYEILWPVKLDWRPNCSLKLLVQEKRQLRHWFQISLHIFKNPTTEGWYLKKRVLGQGDIQFLKCHTHRWIYRISIFKTKMFTKFCCHWRKLSKIKASPMKFKSFKFIHLVEKRKVWWLDPLLVTITFHLNDLFLLLLFLKTQMFKVVYAKFWILEVPK